MLTASGLARSYGPRDLFADVTLQLSAGRRIALVGGNGGSGALGEWPELRGRGGALARGRDLGRRCRAFF